MSDRYRKDDHLARFYRTLCIYSTQLCTIFANWKAVLCVKHNAIVIALCGKNAKYCDCVSVRTIDFHVVNHSFPPPQTSDSTNFLEHRSLTVTARSWINTLKHCTQYEGMQKKPIIIIVQSIHNKRLTKPISSNERNCIYVSVPEFSYYISYNISWTSRQGGWHRTAITIA